MNDKKGITIFNIENAKSVNISHVRMKGAGTVAKIGTAIDGKIENILHETDDESTSTIIIESAENMEINNIYRQPEDLLSYEALCKAWEEYQKQNK